MSASTWARKEGSPARGVHFHRPKTALQCQGPNEPLIWPWQPPVQGSCCWRPMTRHLPHIHFSGLGRGGGKGGGALNFQLR